MMSGYLLYILIWIGVLIVLFLLFKSLPEKIKKTSDQQTKNSLFTLLMLIAIPLILAAVIGPVLLVAGDENMPVGYKYAYGIISLLLIGYLIYLQAGKQKKI